jgi:ribosomal protein S27AE
MTGLTLWQTDDQCPDCGTALTATEDGGVLRVECRSCGYADMWATGPPGPVDRAEAWQASQWLLDEYELDAAALEAGLNGRLTDEAQQQRFLRFVSPGPIFTLKDG